MEGKLEICLLSFDQGWVSKKRHGGVRRINISSTPGSELKEFRCILRVSYVAGSVFSHVTEETGKLQELQSPSLGHAAVSDPAGHLLLLLEDQR